MKMQTKVLTSFLAVGLTVALAGGSTMAWFTAQKTVAPAPFHAGTVVLDSGTSANVSISNASNVNPGDTFEYDLNIVYDGSKAAYVRVKAPDISWGRETTNGIHNILITKAEVNGESITIDQPFDINDLFSSSANALGWTYRQGYFYYNNVILGKEADDGYAAATDVSARTITIKLIGRYDGALTDNSYQDATLTVGSYTIDAIQATNGAPWSAVS